ncbi:hypothetical protein [Haladaptatus salinisoli]|uniref:hypothetical protein n=1 Tax=Haladaptatus salinisoli TaxID=2884876 RepID=UPI001D0A9B1A|nr:hypothetical protein [Haladaptatus salinisoli]
MIDKQDSRTDRTEYDRGFDEGYNRVNEQRRGRRRFRLTGLFVGVFGTLFTLLVAAALIFAVFLGGIWLGSLVTDQPTDTPVTPVIPTGAGADGDVTIVEGDTTVTIAGTGAATVPTPIGDYSIVVEPTTITVPTNGDLSALSIRTGGVTIHY